MRVSTNLKTFYFLILTQTLSMVGSAMTSFAIGIWVFAETGDTTPLLLVGFFTWIPYMVLGGVAGVFADRLSRKNLIIIGDSGQAVLTLLLLLTFASNQFELWQLYTVALGQSLFGLLQGPAIKASVTMLVPEASRDRANAVMQVANPAARLIAPMAAGFLYAFVDIVGIMTIDLGSFVLAVIVIMRMHIPQPRESAESEAAQGTVWQEMKGGVRFLLNRRGLLMLSLYFTYLNFVTAGVWRLIPLYILDITDFNEPLLGVLMAVSSLGLVSGGLITIVWKVPQPRIHTIMPTLALAGIGLIIFGQVRSIGAIAIMIFLMMLPYKMNNALLSSIQQAKIPADMQGRVFGLLGQISIFAQPLALLVTGPIVDQWLTPWLGSVSAMGWYITACGVLLFVMTVVVYALPIIRHLERDLPDYHAEPAATPQTERRGTVRGRLVADER